MTIAEYFRAINLTQPEPKWFSNIEKMRPEECLQAFLGERTLFWPACGSGGDQENTPVVKHINRSKAVHCHILVDYRFNQANRRSPEMLGYTRGCIIDLHDTSLTRIYEDTPEGLPVYRKEYNYDGVISGSIGFYHRDEVIKDKNGAQINPEDHGTKTFAMMFLAANAAGAFPALYDNYKAQAPFVIVPTRWWGAVPFWGTNGKGIISQEAERLSKTPKYLFARFGERYTNYRTCCLEGVPVERPNADGFLSGGGGYSLLEKIEPYI